MRPLPLLAMMTTRRCCLIGMDDAKVTISLREKTDSVSVLCGLSRDLEEPVEKCVERLKRNLAKKRSFERLDILGDVWGLPNGEAWARATAVVVDDETFECLPYASLGKLSCLGAATIDVPHCAYCPGAVFRWFADDLVSEDQFFTPTKEIEGRTLRLEAHLPNDGLFTKDEAFRELVIGTVRAAAVPDAWRRVREFEKKKNDSFRVATYNVLAEAYERQHSETIPSAERLPVALGELTTLLPDIACLQEVDEKYVETFWGPQLEALGYDIWFSSKNGGAREGLVMAVRRPWSFQSRHILPLRVNPQVNTIAQIAEIGDFTVVNTHLYYANDAVAIRHEQMRRILLERPDIVCGDLNAFPSSTALKLATETLHSAYPASDKHFTHIGRGFHATLDYILFKRPLRTLAVPPYEGQALPSLDYPSDHYLLAADYDIAQHAS